MDAPAAVHVPGAERRGGDSEPLRLQRNHRQARLPPGAGAAPVRRAELRLRLLFRRFHGIHPGFDFLRAEPDRGGRKAPCRNGRAHRVGLHAGVRLRPGQNPRRPDEKQGLQGCRPAESGTSRRPDRHQRPGASQRRRRLSAVETALRPRGKGESRPAVHGDFPHAGGGAETAAVHSGQRESGRRHFRGTGLHPGSAGVRGGHAPAGAARVRRLRRDHALLRHLRPDVQQFLGADAHPGNFQQGNQYQRRGEPPLFRHRPRPQYPQRHLRKFSGQRTDADSHGLCQCRRRHCGGYRGFERAGSRLVYLQRRPHEHVRRERLHPQDPDPLDDRRDFGNARLRPLPGGASGHSGHPHQPGAAAPGRRGENRPAHRGLGRPLRAA